MLGSVSEGLKNNSVQSQLTDFARIVNARLSELLPPVNRIPAELHQAIRYSCLAPGKRLRPALTLACCDSVGGIKNQALDAACAIEMIHAFSLIHDDLPAIDNDDLRRGRPTCHIQFGEGIAILAGDALFSLAFECIAECSDDPKKIVQVLKVLTHASGSDGLVGGETVDIQSEGKHIDKETLDYIHSRKTGALIKASCEVGGILGGATQEEIRILGLYGEKVGLAFQIADDVLNETSTPEQLGKSAGSDRERMKATYPAMYGLEESRSKALSLAAESGDLVKNFANSAFLQQIAMFSVERLS